MKSVIVYYSFTGNNQKLAELLKSKLNSDIEQIVEKRKRKGITILLDLLFNREAEILPPKVYLDEYDLILFIAPIWGGKIATPMKSFLKRERANINKYAFISLCSGVDGQLDKINKQLSDYTLQLPLMVDELKINNLLPAEHRNKIKYTTPYRVHQNDFEAFDSEIKDFLNTILDIENQSRVLTPAETDTRTRL